LNRAWLVLSSGDVLSTKVSPVVVHRERQIAEQHMSDKFSFIQTVMRVQTSPP
jgi:hypothetical protein